MRTGAGGRSQGWQKASAGRSDTVEGQREHDPATSKADAQVHSCALRVTGFRSSNQGLTESELPRKWCARLLHTYEQMSDRTHCQ